MNTYNDRVAAATADAKELCDKLVAAAPANSDQNRIHEALIFTALNCDLDNDDYETIEATFLARLEDDIFSGER